MAHTPGPWAAEKLSRAEWFVSAPEFPYLAQVFADGRKPDLAPANAYLIAAAPDLLHALTMVRDADDDCRQDGHPTIPSSARAVIDAALAKAEGH